MSMGNVIMSNQNVLTVEVKSKTERIQIIVKAAAHHLDISGMVWEKGRNDLSTQASQEQIGNG